MQIPWDPSSRGGRFYMSISSQEHKVLNSDYLTLNELPDTDQTLRKRHYSDSVKDSYYYIQCCENVVIPSQPPQNWNFKLLLIKLSKEVTDEDLDIVKFLITGTDDCGTGNLQSASTLKVFDLLRTKNYITSRDLLYLQVILAVFGKHSLIDKVYKYAQNNGDVLHFDPPLRCIDDDDSVTDIYVTGADFRLYTESQLEDFCKRIKKMVSMNKTRRSCKCERMKLYIPLIQLEGNDDTFSNNHLCETDQSPCEGIYRSRRPYVVHHDIGTQTEDDISDPATSCLDETKRLREQLRDAENNVQRQANELAAMEEKMKVLEATVIQQSEDSPSVQTNSSALGLSKSMHENTSNINFSEKDIEYEMNALKKEHEIQSLKLLSLHEKYSDLEFNYTKVLDENVELKIEKTNTDIQVGILQRNLDDLEAKLKKQIEDENLLIEELRNKLELTSASLLNAQNDKRLYELSRLLEQISSMSMTVKKAYGNFDPAHDPISPKQDELFRKSLSMKIGRIFPQIYY